MSRFAFSVVCTLAVLTMAAPRAHGAEPVNATVESVDADTGSVTAKDAQGKSITVVVDKRVASALAVGQAVSIDAAGGTMHLAVPVRVQGADNEMRATDNAASSGKNTEKTTGSGTVVKPDVTPTASEGSTAGVIRGRPNSNAKEFPNMVGEFSPASENPDGEADDVVDMSRFVMPPAARKSETQGTSSAMTISNYSRGGGSADLISRLVKGLKDKEIDVALLGGQKYMVNDCLGLKASAGKFKLKLANPVAKIDGTGVLLTFSIDKIALSALKVRFRPSTNFNPCTWGGRVQVGGEVSDVRLEIRIDPVLDLERGRVADPGQIRAKVRVGNLNLKNVNNQIDKVAKNMIEDSVTFALQLTASGAQAMFYNQLFQTLDDILEADCPGNPGGTADAAKDAAAKVGLGATADTSAEGGAGAKMPTNVKEPGGAATPAADARPFKMVANPALKGRLGRIVLAYPADVKSSGTRFDIFKPGEEKAIQGGYGKAEVDLMPGKYVISVSDKKVAEIEVGSRQDTVLKVGALRINAGKDTRFDVLDSDKKTKLVGGYGTADFGMPVGTYYVQVAGSVEPVTVEEGKVTEF
jgi:hypothetical protein